MNYINPPEDLFRGMGKGLIKRFKQNINNVNQRIHQAKLKNKKEIRFVKGTGKSYLLSDEEFDTFVEFLEEQFDINMYCSYGGDGEKFFNYTIGWE